MVRTQIYLTTKERAALARLAKKRGKSQSELIREAIDGYVERATPADRASRLATGRGLWKDRDDLPDFAALRRTFDR